MSRGRPSPGPRARLVALLVAAAGLVACVSTPVPPPPTAATEPEEPLGAAVAAPPPVEPVAVAPAPAPAPTPGPPPRIADGAALFRHLADGFSPPVCVRGAHNQTWRRRYAGHPRTFEAQLRGALPLMAWVAEEVDARDLPMEYALIPLIESGYRPDARGPGGPTGLWQMIGSTARNHGVIVGRGYDGRLSPVDSTRAALDYLKALHAEFGDWRAAAMAYNAGEGRLRRAFARSGDRRVSGERRLPAGLSAITYAYVAKLHALACLIAEPERHGLALPDDRFEPLDVDPAPAALRSLEAVADAWSIDAPRLRVLNPAYRAGLPPPGRAPRLLLHPSTTAGVASTSVTTDEPAPAAPEPAAAAREHVVARGDTLWRIARRYGTTVRAIAEANGLRVNAPLRLGRVLRIPD